jgi:uncharacterized protein YkwD
LLLCLVSLLAMASLATSQDARPNAPQFKPTKDEATLLELTNKEREKAKLPPLQANEKLFSAARSHAVNMAKQGKLLHELDGKKPADRVTEAGYKFQACGENIAFGPKKLSAVIEMWMNSPDHKENMLRDVFKEIGLGIAVSSDGRPYYVQVFGTEQK